MSVSSFARAGARPSRLKRAVVLTLSLLLWLPLAAQADPSHKGDKGNATAAVAIPNFGKIDEHFFRGAQPRDEQYGELAALGVKTVIDLRDDPKHNARSLAERAGLRYINLPMNDKRYPEPDAADRFLAIVQNPENWPVYVHCVGGRHRTGAMTAVYRMTIDGWDAERAYQEMKQYDFYTRWGHGAMKDYVFDFYRKLTSQRRARQVTTSTPAAASLHQ